MTAQEKSHTPALEFSDDKHPKRIEKTHGDAPLTAWFLGPKAEHGDQWTDLISYIFQDYIHWRRNYFPNDPVVISRERRRSDEKWMDQLNTHLDSILNNLKAHFPFYSPRYIAHMLSEQTLPSVLGYFAGMLYNPNNVTDEAAPVTVRLELEVGKMISEMLGFNPRRAWAHLCSGGTLANIEALWVARASQFVPFIIREYCQRYKINFPVKTANGQSARLTDLNERELIGFRPNESIFMMRKLAKYEVDEIGRDVNRVLEGINLFVRESRFNVNLRGFDVAVKSLNLEPVLFASATAHYSLKKAANLLGYGEDRFRLVPVNSNFRMDILALEELILGLGQNQYVAGVVGIVGTTEEGAVDPIHKIRFLRDRLSDSNNQSFWLHVDAAWGGYIRSMFVGHALEHTRHRALDDICKDYAHAINAREKFTFKTGKGEEGRSAEIWWNDREIYAAFLALADADSVTIDPHKLGYIPYPAGIIAFKNGLVTELITQKAQYISDEKEGLKAIDELAEITAVGPYIVEGSKPGAAAAACWLAHKTIPLTVSGHGKIMRTTLLNARKLTRYLHYHKYFFSSIDEECFPTTRCLHPFIFAPLFEPDTNVICFIALPMAWQDRGLVPVDMELKWINTLNERIYESLSIPKRIRGIQMPYAQPYFVSRTKFEASQYKGQWIEPILKVLRISVYEYNKEGLFVLRSTVMNPLYYTAEHEGKNYLYDFIKHLHLTTRAALDDTYVSMAQD